MELLTIHPLRVGQLVTRTSDDSECLTAGDPGQHRGAADGADLYFAGRQRGGLNVAACEKNRFGIDAIFSEQTLRLGDPENCGARVERRLTDAELDEFGRFRAGICGIDWPRRR